MIRNSGDEQVLRWSNPILPRTLYAKAFELAGVDLFTLAARVTIVGGTVQALLSLGTAGARRIELGLTAASEPYARGMAQVVLGAAIADGAHDMAWIVEPSGQVTCIVDGSVQDAESITFGPLFDRLCIGESCVGGSAWAGDVSELYLYRLEDEFSIPSMLGSDAIITSLPPTVSILFPLPTESFDIYVDGSSLTVSGLCSLASSVLVEMDSGSGYVPFATDAAPGISSFTATGSLLGFLGSVNIRATATGPGGSTPSAVVSITVTPSEYKDVVFGGGNEHTRHGDILGFVKESSFSVSFWCKNPSAGYVIAKATAGVVGWGIVTDGLRPEFRLMYGGFNELRAKMSVAIPVDWCMVVITYPGDNNASSVSMYVDGIPRASAVVYNNLTGNIANSAELNLGGRTNGSSCVSSPVDEVCVWNKELSAAEVAEIYNGGDPFLPTEASCAGNLVGYWPMGEGDTFPTLQDRRLGAELSAIYPTIVDTRLGTDSATYPTILDASGSGFHGTMTNMAVNDIVLDSPGGTFSKFSLDLDGSNDYVNMGNVLGFERTDSFTISCWVKCTALANNGHIFGKIGDSFTVPGYALVIDSSGRPYFALDNSFSTNYIKVTFTISVNDGLWNFVTVTYDGNSDESGVLMYVNASQIIGKIIESNNLTGSILTTGLCTIGRRYAHPSTLFPFKGDISDVSVWDRVLTPAEIAEVYNGGVPTDNRLLSSASNLVGYWRMGDQVRFDGTMTNMAVNDIVLDSPGGTFSKFALDFDGSNDYVKMGDVLNFENLNNEPFTVAAWVKTTDVSGYFVSKMSSTPQGYGLYLDASGYFQFAIISGGLYRIDIRTAITVNDGNWHLIACTYDGLQVATGAHTYVDGVVSEVVLANTLGNRTTLNIGEFNISGRTNGTSVLTERSGDVSVWNRVLTPAEIAEVYNGGVPTDLRLLSSAANLVGYWRMGNQVRFDGTMTNMEAGDIETRTF